MIAPYVCDTALFIQEAIKEGKNILLEGQLGTLKDPDFGIYPMVTSSSTLAGFGSIGAGIAPYQIKEVITVVKAYSSAVGGGEFVSEIPDEKEAEELRKRGGDKGEYGATTGRPRRMGWFDAVASRYGVRIQGTTEVALTVLDVLGYLDEIPVCVGYDINGEIIPELASDEKREMITLNELPQHLIDALITREDNIFFKHAGFSIKSIVRAFAGKHRGTRRGGSRACRRHLRSPCLGRHDPRWKRNEGFRQSPQR